MAEITFREEHKRKYNPISKEVDDFLRRRDIKVKSINSFVENNDDGFFDTEVTVKYEKLSGIQSFISEMAMMSE